MTLSQSTESGLASSGSTCDPNGYDYAIHFFPDRKDVIRWARASSLSMLAGFKKVTDDGLGVAINALLLDSRPHRRLGINQSGQVTVIRIRGDGCGLCSAKIAIVS